ncbi:MAG: amidohydrolase [Lachnospiraceae bacterium]|nr:amidohydrolase [Lachnospiraceae bacterium]
MKIIDTHTHYSDGISVIGGPPVSAGRMVEIMDENNVECCWCSSMTALNRDYREANERQWLETKEYPGRFMNYVVVNGNYPEQVEDEIRRCVEDRGFGGLKFHNWCSGFPIDSKGTHRAMELAIEYDIPVLFHDGTPPWAETLQVAAMAEYYPEARVMIGHAGLFDAWQSAIQACNTHDNIWLGICGPCVGDAAEIIKSVRPDRILFGSDFAVNDKPYLLAERINVLKLACPDEALQQQIFYDNAVEILKKSR